MPRPENKQELLDVIQIERAKLNQALAGLTAEQKLQPGVCGDWSVKDILAHLVDWELRGLRWYREGLRSQVPKIPDEEYNWRELPALNHAIYEKYRAWPLAEIEQVYENTYQETISVLDQISEEELFTPNFYPWTGKALLRDYFNANTASHYRWASKLIRGFSKRHLATAS